MIYDEERAAGTGLRWEGIPSLTKAPHPVLLDLPIRPVSPRGASASAPLQSQPLSQPQLMAPQEAPDFARGNAEQGYYQSNHTLPGHGGDEDHDPVLRQLQRDMGETGGGAASEFLYSTSLVFLERRTRDKYESYRTKDSFAGVTMALLAVSIPAWLVRSPFSNTSPLHLISWILFLFGWILPLVFLSTLAFQLQKMRRMGYPGDVTRPYRQLHQRVSALASFCGVSAMAVQLVARTLSGLQAQCPPDVARSFTGIFGCNQNSGDDGFLPEDQLLLVVLSPLLTQVFLPTTRLLVLLLCAVSASSIVVSLALLGNPAAAWDALCALPVLSVMYEVERQKLELFAAKAFVSTVGSHTFRPEHSTADLVRRLVFRGQDLGGGGSSSGARVSGSGEPSSESVRPSVGSVLHPSQGSAQGDEGTVERHASNLSVLLPAGRDAYRPGGFDGAPGALVVYAQGGEGGAPGENEADSAHLGSDHWSWGRGDAGNWEDTAAIMPPSPRDSAMGSALGTGLAPLAGTPFGSLGGSLALLGLPRGVARPPSVTDAASDRPSPLDRSEHSSHRQLPPPPAPVPAAFVGLEFDGARERGSSPRPEGPLPLSWDSHDRTAVADASGPLLLAGGFPDADDGKPSGRRNPLGGVTYWSGRWGGSGQLLAPPPSVTSGLSFSSGVSQGHSGSNLRERRHGKMSSSRTLVSEAATHGSSHSLSRLQDKEQLRAFLIASGAELDAEDEDEEAGAAAADGPDEDWDGYSDYDSYKTDKSALSLDMACLTVTDTSSNFVEVPVPSHARKGAEEWSFAPVGQGSSRLSSSFPRLAPVPVPLQLPLSPLSPLSTASSGPLPGPTAAHAPSHEAYVRSLAVAKIGAFFSLEAAPASTQHYDSINNNKMSLEDLLLLHSRLAASVRGGKARLEVALQSRHLLSLLEGKLVEIQMTELVVRYLMEEAARTAPYLEDLTERGAGGSE